MQDSNYTSVCDSCYQGTWYETKQPCKREVAILCPNCGTPTGKYKRCTGTLQPLDRSELNERAYRFYKSGERVEITYKDGSKTRCYIGKSTGWKPVYLEVLRRNSSGGGSLYLPDDASIRGLGTYR